MDVFRRCRFIDWCFYLFCLWQHDLCGITGVENHRKLLKKPPKLPAPGWFGLGDGARHKLRGAPTAMLFELPWWKTRDTFNMFAYSRWQMLTSWCQWVIGEYECCVSFDSFRQRRVDRLSASTWARQVQAHPVWSSFIGTKGTYMNHPCFTASVWSRWLKSFEKIHEKPRTECRK